jgi:hypothetical protein
MEPLALTSIRRPLGLAIWIGKAAADGLGAFMAYQGEVAGLRVARGRGGGKHIHEAEALSFGQKFFLTKWAGMRFSPHRF